MNLEIPYIAGLDAAHPCQAINILESEGTRRTVESLNWATEFPYHPLTTFSTGHNGEYLFIDFFVRCNYLRAVTGV